MRIEKISSSGTIAIRSVDINCNTPITLICAHNRGGKTSLRDGIIHAFTGTLKEKPAKLPPEVAAHWIQDGLLKNDQAIEEAA